MSRIYVLALGLVGLLLSLSARADISQGSASESANLGLSITIGEYIKPACSLLLTPAVTNPRLEGADDSPLSYALGEIQGSDIRQLSNSISPTSTYTQIAMGEFKNQGTFGELKTAYSQPSAFFGPISLIIACNKVAYDQRSALTLTFGKDTQSVSINTSNSAFNDFGYALCKGSAISSGCTVASGNRFSDDVLAMYFYVTDFNGVFLGSGLDTFKEVVKPGLSYQKLSQEGSFLPPTTSALPDRVDKYIAHLVIAPALFKAKNASVTGGAFNMSMNITLTLP